MLFEKENELKQKLIYISDRCQPVDDKIKSGLPMWIIVQDLEAALKLAKKLAEEDAIGQENFYGQPTL